VLVRPDAPDWHPSGAHVPGALGVPGGGWSVKASTMSGAVLVQHPLVAPRSGRRAVAARAVLPRASVPWPLAAEGGTAGGTPVGRDLDVQPLRPDRPVRAGAPTNGRRTRPTVPTGGHAIGVRPPLVPAHLPRQVDGTWQMLSMSL
jgi:hypothetical protein